MVSRVRFKVIVMVRVIRWTLWLTGGTLYTFGRKCQPGDTARVKLEFHDDDTDTDTDILARILARK